MTYTLKRYRSYQEYLDADDDNEFSEAKNYRLLDTGDVIEVASEDAINIVIAYALLEAFVNAQGASFIKLLRRGDQEIQVKPVGDRWVNRKPDLAVILPEHLQLGQKAIFFDMPSPAFVAEIVSPGGESSANYQRDYVWKRQQYEWWKIPEYWIIDPHRWQVLVLALVNGRYQETLYSRKEGNDKARIASIAFPKLNITAESLLSPAL